MIWSWKVDPKAFKIHALLKPDYQISTKWLWLYWNFHSKKQKPRVLNYRKYKFYNIKFFREQFLSKLENNNISKQGNSLESFQEKCLTILNSIVPSKLKFMKANQIPFTNKELQQVIMIRSNLRNKFLKSRSI